MTRSQGRVLIAMGCCVLILLCSGCTLPGFPPPGGSTGDSNGAGDGPGSVKERATLGEAMESLRNAEKKDLFDLRNMEITQVLGVRVDHEGKARTWSLGFREGDITHVLEFTGGSWNGVDVQIPLPYERIPLEQLVLPEQLYLQQRKTIDEALSRQGTSESELILKGEVYSLMIPSPSGTTVLTFNARTGDLIASA